MFLAALKPSMAKLGATTLIVITTLLYGVLNTAFTQETAKQMNEAFLGEPFVTLTSKLIRPLLVSVIKNLPSSLCWRRRTLKQCCPSETSGLR